VGFWLCYTKKKKKKKTIFYPTLYRSPFYCVQHSSFIGQKVYRYQNTLGRDKRYTIGCLPIKCHFDHFV